MNKKYYYVTTTNKLITGKEIDCQVFLHLVLEIQFGEKINLILSYVLKQTLSMLLFSNQYIGGFIDESSG